MNNSSQTPLVFGLRYGPPSSDGRVDEHWPLEPSLVNDLMRRRDHYGTVVEEEGPPRHEELTEGVEAMRRLACPYFKRNPKRYLNERSCIGPGWVNTHRLKEHIYRCHSLPIHCFRCRKTFGSDQELQFHQRAENPCIVQAGPLREGVDIRQKETLRSRKRGRREMTEEEKWKDMYRILFPNDDPRLDPDPYYSIEAPPRSTSQSQSSMAFRTDDGDFEDLIRQDIPPQAIEELDRRIEMALYPVEESVKARIVEIVRDFQVYLFQEYRAMSARSEGLSLVGPGEPTSPHVRRPNHPIQRSLPRLRAPPTISSSEFGIPKKPAGTAGVFESQIGTELSPYYARFGPARDLGDMDCFPFDFVQPQQRFMEQKDQTASSSYNYYEGRMLVNTPNGGTREPSPPPSP